MSGGNPQHDAYGFSNWSPFQAAFVVVVTSDGPVLVVLNGTESGAGTGAASPYVIAANNFHGNLRPAHYHQCPSSKQSCLGWTRLHLLGHA
ncbi:hypothetical protein FZEAL_8113 [Fusarium zealandicum]|uniref:Uncharacterized protein n=1 Tax=Fusarium zealandicum TaxID=1053134 RepID=A0A8H4UED7_9HYPO|nr:hypothetical protein FZEAL_8113 [Fusarium zealandicum]